MRALSLHRPWGELIAAGLKRIETRDWWSLPKCLLGGRVAIHAAKKIDKAAARRIEGVCRELGIDPPEIGLSAGGVILCHARVHAVTRLEDTAWERSRALCACWGLVGIHLTDVRRLRTPVPYRGHPRIFHVPDEVLGLEKPQ